MWSIRGAALVALVVWVLVLLYLSQSLFSIQTKEYTDNSGINHRLDQALLSIGELKKQNDQLKNLIEAERTDHRRAEEGRRREKFKAVDSKAADEKIDVKPPTVEVQQVEGYSRKHEETRRKLDELIWEMFYWLKASTKETKEVEFRNRTLSQMYSLLAQSTKFSDQSKTWRREELQKLTNQIQGAISKIQNPKDCSKARVLVCDLDKQCGFGCQLHHVGYCFLVAFGEQRTLVLSRNGKNWRYSRQGWTATFQPVSSCSYEDVLGGQTTSRYVPKSDKRVVELPIVDALQVRPEYLPLNIPKQLEEQLLKLHHNPPVFFVGQFLWYLMRSNEKLQTALDQAAAKIPFDKGSMVGIQVRRTDKIGTEASFHSVDEYMDWVEIWYQIEDKKRGERVPRRVFAASDDPTVIPEIKKKYPQYEVYGDTGIAEEAKVMSRYTDASLLGVITDIRMLSMCDYLVCTFSSQVCRMGYELMQTRVGDAGNAFHSLDDIYYYGGQHDHEQLVVEEHKATSGREIDLLVGDTVGIAGNHWDGWSMGTNKRTGKMGLYPSYKAVEKWRVIDFPALN